MDFRRQNSRQQLALAGSQFAGVGAGSGKQSSATMALGAAEFDGLALDDNNDNDNNLLLNSQQTTSPDGADKAKHHQSSSSSSSNRTTDAQTMMHILKANIGTGVLAMPNAFKNVGLWPGFVLVPIIGAICIHCMNILIASHNHLCDRFNYESLDYDQVAALALACGPKCARRLAKRAHFVVTVFLIFTQVGFCCVYIMFVVENLQLVVLNMFNVQYSTTTYLLLVFPIIGLTSCTSNLKHLARISTFANVLQLAGLGLIFFDLLQFHTYSGGGGDRLQPTTANTSDASAVVRQQSVDKAALIAADSLASRDLFAGLPLFFATAVYAFEGIGVVLPLIKEMQCPARISGANGVLNTSMSMVAILYMAMGFFGYTKYGHFVQGSITLNLPETTLNELVRFIFAVAIGLSYSLQFYVPWTIMWPHIDESLFYSYRPREPRDKLEILNKLSKENEWAIDELEWQYQSSAARQQQPQPQRQRAGSGQQSDNFERPEVSAAVGATPEQQQQQQRQQQQQQQQQQLLLDQNSTASTFATSYTMSTCVQQQQPQLQQSSRAACNRRLSLSSSLVPATNGQQQHYGSISGSQQQQVRARSLPQQQRRNRLEDVMEQELEDSIPEVQWRPPPRSMRGKRKLVRYTVILVSVSFTFVAAALIPRLDLFISLIGALASSCLAIIFPAIIQMCTYWDVARDDADQDDDDGRSDDVEHEQRPPDRQRGDDDARDELGSRGSFSDKAEAASSGCRRRKRSLLWALFIFKNSFLVVFGILGLITGSWVSISQLGAVYMGIEGET